MIFHFYHKMTILAVISLSPWMLYSTRAESNSCAAGYYLQVSSAGDGGSSTQCAECPPNTYSSRNADICTACKAGTSSTAGSTECTTDQTSRLTIFVWILCILSIGVLARLVQIKREQNRRAKARLGGNPVGQRRWASARVVPIADSRFARQLDEIGTDVSQPPISATVHAIELTGVVTHSTASSVECVTDISSRSSAPPISSLPSVSSTSSFEQISADSAVKVYSMDSNDTMPVASAVESELQVLAERCVYGGGVNNRL